MSVQRETANVGNAIKVARNFMMEINNEVRNVNLGLAKATDSLIEVNENENANIELAGEQVVTDTLNACRMTAMEACDTMANLMDLYQTEESKEQIAEYFAEAIARGLRNSHFRGAEGDYAILTKKVIEKLSNQ